MPLLDQHGLPFARSDFKKETAPAKGDAYGNWAGRDLEILRLPGGSFIQFDLSKLNLSDFRTMSEYYQINSSLAVLSFMQHQSDWRIDHPNPAVVDLCTEVMTNIWTELTSAMAQANWAGFSPNALEWDNDVSSKKVVITKIKDLLPEECIVKWKTEVGVPATPGGIGPKFKTYNGIKQFGFPDIPIENSYWYPLLMQNGNYYGRKLLKSAYTPYFFSMLLHLYSNRYYERFGEPTPVGRVPFDDHLEINGKQIPSRDVMIQVLQNLRSRGVVILPSDKTQDGTSTGSAHFDYDIEYLESQMRGADFERYMTRLDQEMSLALFTPVLLLQTADVGSYNLGTGHMQMYLWMLNAINADRKRYIDKYILAPICMYNFTANMAPAKIIFAKQGNTNQQMASVALQALISGGFATPDLIQLGQILGLTITKMKQIAPKALNNPPKDPNADPNNDPNNDPSNTNDKVKNTRQHMIDRLRPQIDNAVKSGAYGDNLKLSIGYRRHMEQALAEYGVRNPDQAANDIFRSLDSWNIDMTYQPITDANDFMNEFDSFLNYQLEKVGVSD